MREALERHDIADVIKELINGVNIYTGEEITGLDENLKRDLFDLYDLFFINKKNRFVKEEEKTVEPKEKIEEVKIAQQELQGITIEEPIKINKELPKKLEINIREGNILINGDRYYLHDGKIADRTGMCLPEGKSMDLLYKYYTSLDTNGFDEEQLKEYVKGIKEAKLWNLCVEVIEKELEIAHKENFIRSILPIYTSALRKTKRSLNVVDFWEMNTVVYSKYGSPEFFTSLAAAYCDIGDYIKARKYADRAFAINGKSSGELMNVYSRIKNIK